MMSGKDSSDEGSQQTSELKGSETVTIEQIDLTEFELVPGARFIFGLLVAIFFFMIPIPVGGAVTVPFDILLQLIIENFAKYARWLGFGLVMFGAIMTIIAELDSRKLPISESKADTLSLNYWRTNSFFGVIRVIGFIFLAILAFDIGPDVLRPSLARDIWIDFLPLFIIVLPLGAVIVKLLIDLGGLDFIGVLARPIMNPMFKLPGRSALDSLASIFGSPIVGYYVTYDVLSKGGYNKRHVYILATCFAPPSLASLALVAGLLDILYLLPLIILSWLVTLIITGVILVRIPPLSRVPSEYLAEPDTEHSFKGSPGDYLKLAKSRAIEVAKGKSIVRSSYSGIVEGMKMGAIISCVILAFIYPVFLIFEHTQVFNTLSTLIAPLIEMLGIPDSKMVATSLITGVGIEILPAIVASGVGVSPMASFFISVVSVSLIIYWASTVPVAMDIFQDIPMRFRDLILLQVLRFIIILPVAALLTHLLNIAGVFR